MLLSMKWLNDYVDVSDIPIKEFCDKMTMSGSKVEGYSTLFQEIENVVVGKIISIEKHPDADKLLICKVDVNKESLLQIVTGAKNIFEGAIIPVALHKSKIFGGICITKGKLRGVMSEGMLCSIGELGLTTNDFPNAIEDGIFIIEEDCKIGQDIKEALGLNDVVVDFEITPNRPDCLSIVGLAREVAAVFNRTLKIQYNKNIDKCKIDKNILKFDIKDKELCKRYIFKIVNNVTIKSSPKWMRERLRSNGIRPINNIVDITNYVMLEFGQPTHAFDYDKIFGNNIVVRKAKDNETINLLNESTQKLSKDMLVVADSEKPIALAGIMGGKESEISNETKTVVFEIANFDSESIRQTSKKLAIRSESSIRFEKGIDNEFMTVVTNRICELIKLLEIGQMERGVGYFNNTKKEEHTIDLNIDFINRLLGLKLLYGDVKSILTRLFLELDGNAIIIPSWRTDITCLADIAEEVARIYGYDKIPSHKFQVAMNSITMRSPEQQFYYDVIDFMTFYGYNEMVTFSFISPKAYDKINLPKDDKLRESIVILNPLGEDTSVMKTTSIPSILEVISKNHSNKNLDCKFFEIAKKYIPNQNNKLPLENDELIIGLSYKNHDFYNIKGVVEDLFDFLNLKEVHFVTNTQGNTFHPGRCAEMFINEERVGVIGQIHPCVAENYQLMENVFVASLDLHLLFKNKINEKTYKQINKFHTINRDLSLICNKNLPVGEIEKIIKKSLGNSLDDIFLTDIYEGEQIADGKKSVCYSLKIKNLEKTLTDEEIDIIINNVLNKLKPVDVYLRDI